MEKVIVIILTLVLTLSLFGYAIVGQSAGAREIAGEGNIQQKKVSMTVKNKNVVYGSTVKQFLEDDSIDREVNFIHETDINLDENDDVSSNQKSKVFDDALFIIEKTYDANGRLSDVEFTQVDLSKTE